MDFRDRTCLRSSRNTVNNGPLSLPQRKKKVKGHEQSKEDCWKSCQSYKQYEVILRNHIRALRYLILCKPIDNRGALITISLVLVKMLLLALKVGSNEQRNSSQLPNWRQPKPLATQTALIWSGSPTENKGWVLGNNTTVQFPTSRNKCIFNQVS